MTHTERVFSVCLMGMVVGGVLADHLIGMCAGIATVVVLALVTALIVHRLLGLERADARDTMLDMAERAESLPSYLFQDSTQ